MPRDFEIVNKKPNTNIKVFGIGGEGGNAINLLKELFNSLPVKTIAINTDEQDLKTIKADKKILIGESKLKGRGTGATPELAQEIMEQEFDKIEPILNDTDMVIVCAGLGGGTGSGAAPVLIKKAALKRILTLAIVTIPFDFEGAYKLDIAKTYLKKIRESADSVIVIPNWKLTREPNISIKKAFLWGNEILVNTIKSISKIIEESSFINIDFQDIRKILENGNDAFISMANLSPSMQVPEEEYGRYIVEELMNFPLIDANTINNIKKMILYVEANENTPANLLSNIGIELKKYVQTEGFMLIPGIQISNNIEGIQVMIIAANFSREDDEYFLPNLDDSPLFGSLLNNRVQNMNNNNNFNLPHPPSMEKDMD